MSTIKPPVSVADSANQTRVDYIQEVVAKPDFDYTPVSWLILASYELYELQSMFYVVNFPSKAKRNMLAARTFPGR